MPSAHCEKRALSFCPVGRSASMNNVAVASHENDGRQRVEHYDGVTAMLTNAANVPALRSKGAQNHEPNRTRAASSFDPDILAALIGSLEAPQWVTPADSGCKNKCSVRRRSYYIAATVPSQPVIRPRSTIINNLWATLQFEIGSSNGRNTTASWSSGIESIEETEGWFEMESIELDDGCVVPEELHADEAVVTEVKGETGASSSTITAVASGNQRHQCPVCGVPSPCRANLQRHMLVHTKQIPVICALCNKGVRDMSSLKRHMLAHSGERPFGCTLCTSRFKFRYDLVKHMRKVHKSITENAPRREDVKEAIRQDTLVTEDIQHHQCPICQVPSASKADLRRHMRVHTKQGPLTCAVCAKSIRDMSSLSRHMMLVHSDKRAFECTLCTSSFKLRWRLSQHMKTVHGQTTENAPVHRRGEYTIHSVQCAGLVKRFAVDQFECKICLRAYPTRKRLRSHLLVHTKHKGFSCATCGNSYRDNDALTRHMLVHSGERPFACSECDFTTKQKYELAFHQRRHTGEVFRCANCDYADPRKSKVERHSKVHANEH
ncbi:oocyte zinc finger protein XlCOF6-like protein [Aphelenchoides avenae]|nr:oocyte zinc finger protein XlCOF6-like protein [Aphelenchus avenae]